MASQRKDLTPITPGETLKEEFIDPLDLSLNRLARDLDVAAGRLSQIINGKRRITADTALRLEKYFGVSAQFRTWRHLGHGRRRATQKTRPVRDIRRCGLGRVRRRRPSAGVTVEDHGSIGRPLVPNAGSSRDRRVLWVGAGAVRRCR